MQVNVQEKKMQELEDTLPVSRKQIQKARETLKRYKTGKANLEDRIVKNEQWYKMRHWQIMKNEKNANDPKPSSGWLFNCIMSKHADFMDAYPAPNVLPREENDKAEAKMLSSIIPVVLKQNGFKKTYSDTSWYKLKNGTSCYGVFWDGNKLNGLGDISIQEIDLLNLFWEPGVKDIQKSKNIFYVDLVDNETMEGMYPQLKGKLGSDTSDIKQYIHDDAISTDGKCLVVDWYYYKMVGKKRVLHYCKFCEEEVLYASENDTKRPTRMVEQQIAGENEEIQTIQIEEEYGQSISERGWYDHGKYPFVFDVLFKEEGLPTGFGYVDVCKEAQESIDRLNNDIEVSARWASRPRFFFREDGGVNEEEFNDLSKALIHVSGNLGEDSIRRIETEKIDSVYLSILQTKVDELKETSGNRDVNNGGSVSGVTAASGIAALQEQSGKTSRDMIQMSYDRFSEVIELVIELIRQFYDMPRKFRIIGEKGAEEFITYTNENLKMQAQGTAFGEDMGYRLPVFDIEVSAQKANPYSKLSQNELALQFYGNGFFNPQLSDQALACVEMMDFEQKDEVIQKIIKNGTLYQQNVMLQQQLLQMAQIIDSLGGSNLSEQVAASITGSGSVQMQGNEKTNIVETNNLGTLKGKEYKIVADAREQANNSTAPR